MKEIALKRRALIDRRLDEIEQYLYNKERGEIVSIVDDFCVCIYAGKEQPMNDFEYLKSCFRFESISFDS